MSNNRWKNYGLWVSIFAFIPLVLNAFGLKVLPANYTELVTALLSILVMAGLISNPETVAKWYLGDEPSEVTSDIIVKDQETKVEPKKLDDNQVITNDAKKHTSDNDR
ncbi:holin [Clostridium frigidicarnis]|uniref:Uncharacterized membrane protein n=1 Tax=Clostridium frigidicarnis TaxID=84698 RepID=A0A1I0WVH6_9CLOT|nr:Uncharacterized membrane protein [Clostridium frigidicarnis]